MWSNYMNFSNLVDQFAKAIQAESARETHENVICVTLGEFEIFFSYLANKKTILLHASVATHDGSKQALAHLLAMNTYFAKTGGICLGIDGAVITAQQNIYIADANHVDTAQFIAQCEGFLSSLLMLITYLNDRDKFNNDAQQTNNTQQANMPNKGIRC